MESIRTEYKDRVEWTNKQGHYHRVDGPAIEWSDGDKTWYLNGERHREDGPAMEWSDGDKSWWLNDIKYSEQDYNDEIMNIRLQRLMEL